ncbi:hypothetical protein [Lacinutrix sp. Hel_I_90]|uniref:hypothetical protein n=1 Tax=Lacinutrix sp. Hel_I_90 TaxID=1249999 RepID=UPI0005C94663|nr:hypothetical protein [Lacinutrix sp. Hel_I_90]
MKNLGSLLLGLIIGALLMYFFFCSGVKAMEPEIIKPKGVITAKEAMVLDEAFNSRHTLISDSIVKRADNRSAWWSLEDMRNYLNYAENQSKELGYTMDGVRVYLGAYPDTTVDSTTTVGYTTLFIAPTSSEVGLKGGAGASFRENGGDVPGGDPLNDGHSGVPPSATYPQ